MYATDWLQIQLVLGRVRDIQKSLGRFRCCGRQNITHLAVYKLQLVYFPRGASLACNKSTFYVTQIVKSSDALRERQMWASAPLSAALASVSVAPRRKELRALGFVVNSEYAPEIYRGVGTVIGTIYAHSTRQRCRQTTAQLYRSIRIAIVREVTTYVCYCYALCGMRAVRLANITLRILSYGSSYHFNK
eukprot:6211853-Pleurochrysis_carterae.AAC.3